MYVEMYLIIKLTIYKWCLRKANNIIEIQQISFCDTLNYKGKHT